jgi:cyclophilin family peptidyl-prolyl cis-trans isomerase
MDRTPLDDRRPIRERTQCVRAASWCQRTGILLLFTLLWGPAAVSAQEEPRVVLETTLGSIVIDLDSSRAPITVDNFLKYIDAGIYDGVLFHRVVRNALIQTGLITTAFEIRHPILPPIRNEADNRASNLRGTVAMARLAEPHSAEVQFFINVRDNTQLDHQGRTDREWGYAVFGFVREGMDVVDRIAEGRTTRRGDFEDFPEDPVVIYAAYRLPMESQN